MLSRFEPPKEKEMTTTDITTMFLTFAKFVPQRSCKHGSFIKKKVFLSDSSVKTIFKKPLTWQIL